MVTKLVRDAAVIVLSWDKMLAMDGVVVDVMSRRILDSPKRQYWMSDEGKRSVWGIPSKVVHDLPRV